MIQPMIQPKRGRMGLAAGGGRRAYLLICKDLRFKDWQVWGVWVGGCKDLQGFKDWQVSLGRVWGVWVGGCKDLQGFKDWQVIFGASLGRVGRDHTGAHSRLDMTATIVPTTCPQARAPSSISTHATPCSAGS